MISRDDCIGLCGLDEAEVQALAEHEHVPEIAAKSRSCKRRSNNPSVKQPSRSVAPE